MASPEANDALSGLYSENHKKKERNPLVPATLPPSLPASGRGRGGNKFVSVDFCRDPNASVARGFHADDLALAPDVDVAVGRNLLRKRQYKIDFRARLEFGVGKKIQAPVADVAGLPLQLLLVALPWQHTHRKRHVEAPRFPAFGSVRHQASASLPTGAKLSSAHRARNAKIQQFRPSTRFWQFQYSPPILHRYYPFACRGLAHTGPVLATY